jgi:hypothetical protein
MGGEGTKPREAEGSARVSTRTGGGTKPCEAQGRARGLGAWLFAWRNDGVHLSVTNDVPKSNYRRIDPLFRNRERFLIASNHMCVSKCNMMPIFLISNIIV